MSEFGRVVVVCLVGAMVCGCSSVRNGVGLPKASTIDEINLLTMPMALNLDKNPGADGFAVKIYAIDRSHPKAVAITAGSLVIEIHDGIVAPALLSTNVPTLEWVFSATELAPYAQNTSVGVVYALTPTWRDRKPGREQITVTACYVASDRKTDRRVCSRPTTVTVALPASYK